MPWSNPKCLSFTRTDIGTDVPAASGVYGLVEDDKYLFVGETWNLQQRLLDLAAVLEPRFDTVSVIYETCPENERAMRKRKLSQEFLDHPHLAALG